ncbi:MAG: hypothetical protein CM1200mP28_01430 [Deltaproteobacteria bacterium]|nr:MAG: hypothetical protein CM1200mP28_01430 [Deltaproteobacteria bacterium]
MLHFLIMDEQYGAIILAGGRSSRMGEDKASLEISGKSWLRDFCSSYPQIVTEVVVMRAPGQTMPNIPKELQGRIQVGWDSVKDRGPLQGIVDALPLLNSTIERCFCLLVIYHI